MADRILAVPRALPVRFPQRQVHRLRRAPGRSRQRELAVKPWQALRAPGGDYQIFVHLRDEGGRTVAQRDTRPQNDRHPTTAWRAGDLVLDDASLPLPATLPPGRYTIVLGLYPPGRPRLPVRPGPGLAPAPNDELPLATIEVVR